MRGSSIVRVLRETLYWRSRWARKRLRTVVRRYRRRFRRLPGASGSSQRVARVPPPSVEGSLASARRELERVASSDVPVIAGPWLGEVGFELLYWIPFLQWAVEEHPDLADRLHVISRGGPAGWYGHVSHRYADAFELLPPDEIRRRRERHKQVDVTQLERDLLAKAATGWQLSRFETLHPGVMYRSLLDLSRIEAAPAFAALARHKALPPPAPAQLRSTLPDEYVAVKFYFSNAFPDTPDNRRFAAEVIRRLSADVDVVLLNTGLQVDDHHDFEPGASGRITAIAGGLEPASSLAVQGEVIAGASAFVGTYGGLSYLPAFYGVPSISFYSRADQFIHRHLHFAQGVFTGLSRSAYMVLDTAHLDALDLLARREALLR